jgi:hypothetical protein
MEYSPSTILKAKQLDIPEVRISINLDEFEEEKKEAEQKKPETFIKSFFDRKAATLVKATKPTPAASNAKKSSRVVSGRNKSTDRHNERE